MKKEEILKRGSVEVHAKVGGIRQRHVLRVEREKTAWGMVPYLVCEHKIPAAELIRLAEELQLPIKCRGMAVFPKGKAAQDFVEKEERKPGKKKGLSHDRIVKEEAGEKEGEDGAEEEPGEEAEGQPEEKSEEKTEPAEKGAQEEQAAPQEEKESAAQAAPMAPEAAPPQEQAIEIEAPGAQQDAKSGDALNADEAVKEKKKTFGAGGVLSEDILR